LGSGLSFGVCDAATGTAEREAAETMLLAGRRPRTLATDDHYDEARCVATLRAAAITPPSGRTTRRPGDRRSQRTRKLVEQTSA
jgi:IS5 family transposase